MGKTYVFDIDDTVLFSTLENGTYTVQSSNEALVKKMRVLKKQGDIIILHTARHWNYFSITKTQLEIYDIPYDTVIMGKPVADKYVDDKGITPENFLSEVHT